MAKQFGIVKQQTPSQTAATRCQVIDVPPIL